MLREAQYKPSSIRTTRHVSNSSWRISFCCSYDGEPHVLPSASSLFSSSRRQAMSECRGPRGRAAGPARSYCGCPTGRLPSTLGKNSARQECTENAMTYLTVMESQRDDLSLGYRTGMSRVSRTSSKYPGIYEYMLCV